MATKSPLTGKPLRQAGQSLEEEIQRILDEDVTLTLIYPAFLFGLMALEWWRWWKAVPPSPLLYSLVFVVVLVWAVSKLTRLRRKVRRLRLGRDGERVVGEYLEKLRAQGCHVFHDILGEGFNLDHVVLCEQGVYVIETKTYSKPDKGEAKIRFDGQTLALNGRDLGEAIVVQAKAEAHWLQQLLKEVVGVKVPVRPVVVFPGWYVETVGPGRQSEVWVLNPKALPTFLQNAPPVLRQDQLKTLVFNLSRYVRAAA